jgi:alginate O-acetyltransferase complex protein AlgI
MAVGLGYMLGFRFPENFNYPCAARSMHDFWTRWHITFTRWIRDYLFIPMGGLRRPAKGSRFPQARLYWTILLVFLLVGLWHGARWNFVIWGGLHGLLIIIERLGLLNRIKKWPAPFQHAYVLAAFTTIGIFFMTPTPGHAARFIAAMYGYFHGDGVIHNMAFYLDGRTAFYFIVACIASTPLLPRLKAWKAGRFSGPGKSDARLRIILSASYNIYLLFLFVLSLMSMASGVYHPFVYYRF